MFSAGVSHTKPGQGTTIRQPATAQLLIDSLDRFQNGWPANGQDAQNNSSSNWRLNLQQIVLNGYLTRLGVSQIMFQWNLPTIIEDYNDKLLIDYDGTLYQVNLVPGYYDVDSMATMLQTEINSDIGGGAAFAVTWNALRGLFEFDSGAGHTFFFTDTETGDAIDLEIRRTLHTIGVFKDTTAAQTFFGVPPTMLATRYIDICSSYLTKYQRLKDANTLPSNITSTAIARIFGVALNSVSPIRGSTALTDPASPGTSPYYIAVDYTFPKQISWNSDEGLSNFDIQLRDEDGELVPYNPSKGIMCEYNIVLLASED